MQNKEKISLWQHLCYKYDIGETAQIVIILLAAMLFLLAVFTIIVKII